MSLLDKIVASSLNEAKITKRLADLSYSAINGERQEVVSYAPEGVVMLGQMGREKPLDAITKEMIQEYQEEQQKPVEFVDGVPMKYKQTGMKVDFKPIVDYTEYENRLKDAKANRGFSALNIVKIERALKEADNERKVIEYDMANRIITPQVLKSKEKNDREIAILKDAYQVARKKLEQDTYNVMQTEKTIDEIKKQNAINKEENDKQMALYTTELTQRNRNRLNIQQQPYESDFDYYRRLKEIERERFDPVLYKQISLNSNIKQLKEKLPNLFKETSMVEDIIKKLNDQQKFVVNKNFDAVQSEFMSRYGYNPSMSVDTATTEIIDILKDIASSRFATGLRESDAIKRGRTELINKEIQDDIADQIKEQVLSNSPATAATTLQNAMRNKFARKKYADKQTEQYEKGQVAPIIQAIMKRKGIQPLYNKIIEEGLPAATKLQGAMKRQGIQPFKQTKAAASLLEAVLKRKGTKPFQDTKEEAATLLQSAFRGYKGRKEYKKQEAIREKQLERIRWYPVKMPDNPWGQTVYDEDTGTMITYPSYEEARKQAEEEYLNRLRLANVINKPVRKYLTKKAEMERAKAEAEYPAKAAARAAQVATMTPSSLFARPEQPLTPRQQEISTEEMRKAEAKRKYQETMAKFVPPEVQLKAPDFAKMSTEEIQGVMTTLENYVEKLAPPGEYWRNPTKEWAKQDQNIKNALNAYDRAENAFIKSKRRPEAATKIQQFTRTRRKAKLILDTAKKLKQERDVIIKNTVSGIMSGLVTDVEKKVAADEVKKRQATLEMLKEEMYKLSGATTIPGESPVPLSREVSSAVFAPPERQEQAVIKMQSVLRGRKGRKTAQQIRAIKAEQARLEQEQKVAEQQQKVEKQASTIIQSALRGRKGRQEAQQARLEQEQKLAKLQLRQVGATKLQSVLRGRKGRQTAQQMRAIKAEQARLEQEQKVAEQQQKVEKQASTIIQSALRGRKGRQEAQQMREQQATKVIKDVLQYQGMRKDVRSAINREIGDRIAKANLARGRAEQERQLAIARQKAYDDTYNAVMSAGGSAASAAGMATTAAARVTASTIGYVVPAVAGVATNVATSALTGLGRSMGFFKTAEEKAAEAERKRIAEEKRKATAEAAKKIKELEKLQKQLEEQKRKEEEKKQKPKQRTPSPPKEDDPLAQSMAKLEELKRKQAVIDINAERLLKRTEFPSFTRKELKEMPPDVLNSYLYLAPSGAPLSADAYEAKYGVNENYRKIWEEKERRTRQRYESQLKPEPTTVAEVLAAKLTTPKSPSPPKPPPLPTGIDLRAKDFDEMTSAEIQKRFDDYDRYLRSRTPDGKIVISTGAPWYDRDYKDVHNAWQRASNALTKAKKAGRGIGKKIPKSRKVTVSQEDKMKNRLRLVVSQIQAGNTNPKLIIEVNKLYKKLYNIPNAYSLIKK